MLQLRDYQVRALREAQGHDGFALFMEQRTGKTYTALELAREWSCTRILVVCPKKGVPVWNKAIPEVGGNPEHFTIMGFEAFRIQHTKLMKHWDLMIVDESHRIKERGSQQTKACWKVGKYAKRRLILSGTPQGNGMEDYYAQLKFIRPDLFGTWKAFSDKYLVIENQWRQGSDDPFPKIVGYKNQEHFKEILKGISFRVTRDEVSSVKTRVRNKVHWLDPGPELTHHYHTLDTELMLEINQGLITTPLLLTKALRLHQLCGGFIHDDEGELHRVHTQKLEYLRNLILTELKSESFVIVANYRAEVGSISELLEELGITHVQISGGYQYDPHDRSQVTILNPSAGEAINLAHHTQMVIYSMNYSFLKWGQFKDRIVLVNTPEVKYHYLLFKGMMDESVYGAVVKKKKLSEEVMSVYKQRTLP